MTTALAWFQPSRHRRSLYAMAAACCWLLAIIGISGIVYKAFANGMIDLVVYRSGGKVILHGARLYSMRTKRGLWFTYPPISAILATSLAVLPLHVAMAAWIPMVYVPLAVAVWYGFRPLLARAGPHALTAFVGVLGLCALLQPVLQEMSFGQVDLLLLALCLLDSVVSRPRWPRGVLIGLSTAIKLYPGVFIIYLLITGRRKAAAIAMGTFIALTGAAFLIAPKDSVTYWTSALFEPNRLGSNTQPSNQSLRGMLLRAFLPQHSPDLIWLLLAAVVGAVGFAAARACWRLGNDLAGIAIAGLLATALSPVAWIHHMCWAVIAIGVIIGTGASKRRVILGVAALGLFLSRLPIWAQAELHARQLPQIPGQLLEDSFGIAAMALILVLYLIVRRTAEAGQEVRPEPVPALTSPAGLTGQVALAAPADLTSPVQLTGQVALAAPADLTSPVQLTSPAGPTAAVEPTGPAGLTAAVELTAPAKLSPEQPQSGTG